MSLEGTIGAAQAEVERLRREIGELQEQAHTASLRTFARRKVLPAEWVEARCAYILGRPITGGAWRIAGPASSEGH